MTVIVKDDSGGCQVNDAARHALAHSGGEGAGNIRARRDGRHAGGSSGRVRPVALWRQQRRRWRRLWWLGRRRPRLKGSSALAASKRPVPSNACRNAAFKGSVGTGAPNIWRAGAPGKSADLERRQQPPPTKPWDDQRGVASTDKAMLTAVGGVCRKQSRSGEGGWPAGQVWAI